MRSIPAWAGETAIADEYGIGLGVYPRVGGGNWRESQTVRHAPGLSPRGRGKRV